MQRNNKFPRNRLTVGVAAAALTSAMSTQALEFEFADGEVTMDWDTSVTYGAMWRTQSPTPNNKNLAASWNTNDGTYNFDTGLAGSKLTVLSEADIRWRDYGFFVRGKAFYDYRYEDMDTDQTDYTYLFDNSGDGGDLAGNGFFLLPPSLGAAEMGDLPKEDFHEETKDIHGQDAFFLDAFLYGDFEIGGKFLHTRLGRQVISWGESEFFPGISNAQSHLDAAAAGAPGTQVKELFMPIGSLYGNISLSESVSVEAYYQYEWKPVKQAGVGSYWSNNDTGGAGAERFILASGSIVIPIDMQDEIEPDGGSDDDGWGVAVRYFMESGTELGFYRMRYHSKYPSIMGISEDPLDPRLPTGVAEFYNPDQDLWGASLSTLVGDVVVAGEVSYVPNGLPTQQTVQPVRDEDGVLGIQEFTEGHVTQFNIKAFYVWDQTAFADRTDLLVEAAYVRHNLDESDATLVVDRDAWGYAGLINFKYVSVFPGVDITVSPSFKHGVDGTWKDSAIQHNAKEIGLKVKADYLGQWKFEMGYATFWGSKESNTKHDRDNASLSVSYTF